MRMSKTGCNAGTTSTGISQSAIRESDTNPASEQTGSKETEIGKEEIHGDLSRVDNVEPTPKKSLAFELPFIELAASIFVFQLEATCLSIALPVSNNNLISCLIPGILTYAVDHSCTTKGSESGMRFGLPIPWGEDVSLLRPNLLPMQASVENVNDTGLAIGLLFTIRMFGGLVGLTVASAIFNTVFSTSIYTFTIQLTDPLAPLSDVLIPVAFVDKMRSLPLSPEALDLVLRGYLGSFQTIFYTMTGIGKFADCA
ncbi:hypothetical protein FQN55_004021 [Onygenales sp. PD_40]|nr:hypothetical protein FQN55_004021 [Onygenales sp. PD_40]KAK2775121.1 hypothetical protein FQN53_003302 [Emmonsiellopsis sp. PD_33]KAK2791437.1 hypothetical protein FQN52_004871 [Onygenales sp. PD_12]